jgi:hypothetical protein
MTITIDLASKAQRCLESWTSGDLDTTRSLLSDDVTFDGPMGHTEGADAYVTGVAQMAQMVGGVHLKKLIVDGDDVCIMYDLLSEPAGPMPTVGWYHFDGDKIDAVRAYFDPRPLTEMAQTETAAPKNAFQMPLFAAGLQLCGDSID